MSFFFFTSCCDPTLKYAKNYYFFKINNQEHTDISAGGTGMAIIAMFQIPVTEEVEKFIQADVKKKLTFLMSTDFVRLIVIQA